ncbi:MAG TPA: alpha,alpha-trehalase TreF, partial [Chitinophagaceae bacterium]|nr:alpha,alpha-trehalase TreF [Chitinophagaceae bacterium]
EAVNNNLQSTLLLFEEVQMSRLFADGKTFVDCLPKSSPEEINSKYIQQKNQPGFDLEKFIRENFDLPVPHSDGYSSDPGKSVEENIETLWGVLTRQPDRSAGTLIPLPYPYIVPGGRFGEIYYWDSYFTMLGLKASGKNEMLENMVKNFSYLIETIGYIPNGNRTYFIGRSQPPFYSLMIKILAEIRGDDVLLAYLPYLEKEYQFWMKGAEELNEKNIVSHHVVRMPEGEILNRYWDENDSPRPESYREDVELSHQLEQEPGKLFRNLRAGAESGWDFSCRWFKDVHSFASIHTTDIIPVDLNCLLLHLEQTIAEAYQLKGDAATAKKYEILAGKRKFAIQQYCWSGDKGFYFDYDIQEGKQKELGTIAAASPLFFGIATNEQANLVASVIKEKFLKPGGVVSTLETTGQQWDSPNGWAPLQWMTIIGLENYGHAELAKNTAKRWIQLNTDVFKRTGKLMEKYNVVDTHLEAGGGEYAGQDGFGWTNGVLLALIKKYTPVPAR